MSASRGWHDGYGPFGAIGADTFIAVTSSRNILFTCDPEAVNHILRSNAFDKPMDLLKILNVFGPTMTGISNQELRLYRKITTPFFNEDSMQKIWTRSLDGGQAALKILVGSTRSRHVEEIRSILAKLSLYLVNVVCFESHSDCADELRGRSDFLSSHNMSYSYAMHTMLDQFRTIFITPHWLLKKSPMTIHQKAGRAFIELLRYMEDLRDSKQKDIIGGETQKNFTILDLIVRAGETPGTHPNAILRPSTVIGNIFILTFASHEANTNTLTFAILLLACHPPSRQLLQDDIDRILGRSAHYHHNWHYESLYPLLSESMVGATINETLRIATVLPFLPKSVPENSPQSININNSIHVIPSNTLVLIKTSAVHRHPKFWPEPRYPLSPRLKPNLVACFNPQQWLPSQDTLSGLGSQAKGFLRPQPGTFIPFSDGIRGCLGKKIALFELCALITRIFSEYGVELAVDGLELGIWNKFALNSTIAGYLCEERGGKIRRFMLENILWTTDRQIMYVYFAT